MRFFTLKFRCVLARSLAMMAACGLALLSASSQAADKKGPLMSVPEPVRDLYYGDALFYFFQEKYFDSLVRMDAALTLGRIEHHKVEAELVRGALYLSLGEHVEAGKIFHELLNDNVSEEVRNRAWYFLGKIYFQRGYYQDAEAAFNSIKGTLSERLETERRMLMAEILLSERRFDEAIAALQALDHSKKYIKKNIEITDSWSMYARFNLGVALMRQNRVDEAIKLLETVGQMRVSTEELAALKDKANVALGFSLLKEQHPLEAQKALERVRLLGPLSNKALLGLGWAQSQQGEFNAALVPWLELKKRNMLDPAVQEALLAIPYAYGQLKSEGQAAEFYASAMQLFEQETARIDSSIQSIQGGSLIATVLANEKPGGETGWYWQLRNLPDAPETRYLYDLLASNAFQEALKNFRDLRQMRNNLEEWLQNLDAFQDMVDTRKIAYEQRTAAMKKALDEVDMDGLENKVLDFDARLKEIERNEDVVTLATAEEQQNWQRVLRVEEAAAQNSAADPESAEMRDKIRLMKGVLYWNMSTSFKARLWREQKELRELAVATKEARRRYTLVGRARDNVPKRNEEFARRVADLTPRLQAMLGRCLDVDQAQGDYLAKVATTQLQQQKDRLSTYALQAQFALASIYDRAADAQRPVSKAPKKPDEESDAGDAAPDATDSPDETGTPDATDTGSPAPDTPATEAPQSTEKPDSAATPTTDATPATDAQPASDEGAAK